MKKFLSVLFLLITFFSCCPYEKWLGFQFDEIQFSSPQEVCEWVCNNIEYEDCINDNWPYPEEVLTKGKGNCQAIAILTLSIINYQFDYDPYTELFYEEYFAQDPYPYGHSCIKVNGESYMKMDYKNIACSFNFIEMNYQIEQHRR